jgi:hypothetical protein
MYGMPSVRKNQGSRIVLQIVGAFHLYRSGGWCEIQLAPTMMEVW